MSAKGIMIFTLTAAAVIIIFLCKHYGMRNVKIGEQPDVFSMDPETRGNPGVDNLPAVAFTTANPLLHINSRPSAHSNYNSTDISRLSVDEIVKLIDHERNKVDLNAASLNLLYEALGQHLPNEDAKRVFRRDIHFCFYDLSNMDGYEKCKSPSVNVNDYTCLKIIRQNSESDFIALAASDPLVNAILQQELSLRANPANRGL